MTAKKIRRWKFLRSGLKSNYDGHQWVIGKWQKTECLGLCQGFNCSRRIIDALNVFHGEILAEVEVEGRHFVGDNKSTHEGMRIIHAWHWTKADSVALSIFAAEMVLGNFGKVYPDDDRPRKAIEAARNYLDSPTEKNRCAARSAWSAAWSAAESASESASESARSAALDEIETWLLNHIEQMEEWK